MISFSLSAIAAAATSPSIDWAVRSPTGTEASEARATSYLRSTCGRLRIGRRSGGIGNASSWAMPRHAGRAKFSRSTAKLLGAGLGNFFSGQILLALYWRVVVSLKCNHVLKKVSNPPRLLADIVV